MYEHYSKITQAALEFFRSGRQVLPIELRENSEYSDNGKNPSSLNGKLWQNRRFHNEQEIVAAFNFPRNGSAINIGVILGQVSGDLVDIDLDCPEAVIAASFLLPETATFGRASLGESHYLYEVSEWNTTKKYVDPIRQNQKEAGRAMIVEMRGNGQTVFPPSTHNSGEEIVWFNQSEPLKISAEELKRCVGKVAAAVFISRFMEKNSGIRQQLILHLSGALLLKAKWTEDEVAHFVATICRIANDEEKNKRLKAVEDTAADIKNGNPVSSYGHLAELIEERNALKIAEWLGFSPRERSAAKLKKDIEILDEAVRNSREAETDDNHSLLANYADIGLLVTKLLELGGFSGDTLHLINAVIKAKGAITGTLTVWTKIPDAVLAEMALVNPRTVRRWKKTFRREVETKNPEDLRLCLVELREGKHEGFSTKPSDWRINEELERVIEDAEVFLKQKSENCLSSYDRRSAIEEAAEALAARLTKTEPEIIIKRTRGHQRERTISSKIKSHITSLANLREKLQSNEGRARLQNERHDILRDEVNALEGEVKALRQEIIRGRTYHRTATL